MLFLAAGQVRGENWTLVSSPGYYHWDVAYGGGLYVCVGYNGSIHTSADGITWTAQTSGTSQYLKGVVYETDNNQFLVVGYAGTVLTSPGGINWTAQSSGTGIHFRGVSYGNGLYVAVGDSGAIYTSSDGGVNWTARDSEVTDRLYATAYGNPGGSPTFVVAGANGRLLISGNGINWGKRTSRFRGNYIYDVVFAGGQFIAVGYGGKISTSPNGSSWTARTSGTSEHLYGVAFGNSIFVAVGYMGTIISSSDGVTWAAEPSPTTEHFLGIGYGARFIAVGQDMAVYSTPN